MTKSIAGGLVAEAQNYINYSNRGDVDQNTAALVAAQNGTTYAILALLDVLRGPGPDPEQAASIRDMNMQGRTA